MLKRTAGLVVIAATVAGFAASAGHASTSGTSGAFLCYSKYQTNPGFWPFVSPKGGHEGAQALLAKGYWSPFAEKSVPTKTQMTGGWYLLCNLPPTMQTVTNTYRGDKGGPNLTLPPSLVQAGDYPVAQ
jgi:hypothetical protein